MELMVKMRDRCLSSVKDWAHNHAIDKESIITGEVEDDEYISVKELYSFLARMGGDLNER